MSKATVPMIKPNVLLNIELSTNFYFRISHVLNTKLASIDKKLAEKVLNNIKEQKNAETMEEEELMVLLVLAASVEEQIKVGNHFEMKEIDINED